MIEIPLDLPAPTTPPPAFAWPADAAACTSRVLTVEGAVARVARGEACSDALAAHLDSLVGLRFPGLGSALFEVRLAPRDGDGRAVFEPVHPWPRGWPESFGGAGDVPFGTTCRGSVTWSPGGPGRIDLEEGCPFERQARRLDGVVWQLADVPPGELVHLDLDFAWIADPRDARRPVIVPGAFSFPRTRVAPSYPGSALDRPPRVRCVGGLDVGPDGAVAVREVYGCEEPFAAAARDALSQWRYWPKVVDGVPVSDQATIAVQFVSPDGRR